MSAPTLRPKSWSRNSKQVSPTLKRKRSKISYACANCKHRKVKCDRIFPCRQCSIKEIEHSCGLDKIAAQYDMNPLESDELSTITATTTTATATTTTTTNSVSNETTNLESELYDHQYLKTEAMPAMFPKTISPEDLRVLEALYKTLASLQGQVAQFEQSMEAFQVGTADKRSTTSSQLFQSIFSPNQQIGESSIDIMLIKIKQLEVKFDIIIKWLEQGVQTIPEPTDDAAAKERQGEIPFKIKEIKMCPLTML